MTRPQQQLPPSHIPSSICIPYPSVLHGTRLKGDHPINDRVPRTVTVCKCMGARLARAGNEGRDEVVGQ
ncbi:hypothetical protein C0Q70_21144 [Pomacea canaliculata]|uniref:Uncharacterized protein n=1 Tax=Pomacea canaliculata TaxID=400727 RepID=A0A2T7NBP5_POMCA|nr:hypothetical protein C0Q70_21144 [Pomacea canaliculata]